MDDVPLFAADVGHHTPNRVKIHCTTLLNKRSRPNKYRPKKTDVRMTTNVVAYTSLLDGQLTRFNSLRTSVRKVRIWVHHPVTTSVLTFSSMAIFMSSLSRQCVAQVASPLLPTAHWLLHDWQAKRDSNPQP